MDWALAAQKIYNRIRGFAAVAGGVYNVSRKAVRDMGQAGGG